MQTRPINFFDVEDDVGSLLRPLQTRFERTEHPTLHPDRSACVVPSGHTIGWIGELHPRWLQEYDVLTAPVVWELGLDAITAVGLPKYREIPRVSAVMRDITLVVCQDVAAQDLVDILEKTAVGTPWEHYL